MSDEPPLEDGTLVLARPGNASCDLDGEAVVLNLDSGLYHGLDGVGGRVWALVQEGIRFGALRQRLLAEYEVDEPILDGDLRRLLGEMRAAGLVELRPA